MREEIVTIMFQTQHIKNLYTVPLTHILHFCGHFPAHISGAVICYHESE